MKHFRVCAMAALAIWMFATWWQAVEALPRAQASNTLLGLINTGDLDNDTAAPDGGVERHWSIVSGPNGAQAAFVALQNWPISGHWTLDSPWSKWIAPQPDAYQNDLPGDYTYQTTFQVNGDPTVQGFTCELSADDTIIAVRLNGNTVATNLPCNFLDWYPLDVPNGLVAGQNTLQIVVRNLGTSPNPTGLRAEFDSYLKPVALPAPPVTVAPILNAPAPLTVTQIVPNDDSAKITFVAMPGAADYRIVNLAKPGFPKYAGYPGVGGVVTMEMNGLDPINGSNLRIDAVDQLGPFQDMDPYLPMTGMIVNGHGLPTNNPNVLASSAAFHVTCQPRSLTGGQVFFDNFHTNVPFSALPLDPYLANLHTFSSQVCYQDFQNDKWKVTLFDHDTTNTRIFFMSSHFMDILYDYHQTLRAKTVLTPLAQPTLAPGQVLHVTFEVDGYLSLNRTVGVLVLPAGDKITYPPAAENPTDQGNAFDWQIAANSHNVNVYTGGIERGVQSATYGVANATRWVQQWASGPMGGGLNGGEADLDRRHQFDLYISSTRYVILENGQVMNDIPLNSVYAGPPGNVYDDSLGWFYNQPVKVAFYHYLYHSQADNYYLRNGEISPSPYYWLNRRPFSDERHWDNMGFEVLSHFPTF